MKEETTSQNSLKVAWLLQRANAYYQPIMSELTNLLPQTQIFTTYWSGFLVGFEDSINFKEVGKVKFIPIPGRSKGFGNYFTYLPLNIVNHLFQFKPDAVFSVGFTIWTALSVFLKFFHRGKVIIVYDGSSPDVDFKGSRLRLFYRRLLVRFADALITNTKAGKSYLTKTLDGNKDKVFDRPYLVPHPKTYDPYLKELKLDNLPQQRPIFLFAGNLIPRKGLEQLLKALCILQKQKIQNYTLLVIGDGEQRGQLEAFVRSHNLEKQVKFIGAVPYEHVGVYLQKADIFVFPTLEDIWGMVAVEAMMFGKPILCSKWAGTSELMVEEENAYLFDPHKPEELATLMSKLIAHPELIVTMGEKSYQIMLDHTPKKVAQNLVNVVNFVVHK